MQQYNQASPKNEHKIKWFTKTLIFLFASFFALNVHGQQRGKIQQMVNSIKATYNNEHDDLITDGQRTVWVKSYKKWGPDDLALMKKSAPGILHFLNLAAEHQRVDVLDQLLPDYYNSHGGVKAFAADIVRNATAEQSSVSRLKTP